MGDEDPLGGADDGSILDEDVPTVFLSVGVGSGSGYVNGPTEKTKSDVGDCPLDICFAPALLHVMPELGYYLNKQSSVSVAFRMGFPIGANVDGHATFAPAGLLRYRYALDSVSNGLQFSGVLGAGVIRNTVTIKNAADDMDTDTTVMGPVLVGGGVGYVYALGGPMRLVAEVNALAAVTAGVNEVGCPGEGCVALKNGAQFDANIAMLFAF